MEIGKKIASVIPVSAVGLSADGSEFTLEYHSVLKPASEIVNAVFFNDAVEKKDGSNLFNYSDIDNCFMCYHLIIDDPNIKSENECCMQFFIKGIKTEVCSDKTTDLCQGEMKAMLKKIY